jgi:ferredoxin
MNLVSVAERVAAIERSTVVFDPGRCLHTADKFSNCAVCFGMCPAHAIQPGKPPTLNAEACETCLACLPVCPTGAFSADDAVPALLNCAARVGTQALELVCERNPNSEMGLPDTEAAIQVRGCLAGLGVGGYLALIALGIEKIVVRTEACAQCSWGSLPSRIEAQVDLARRLLEPWGRSGALARVSSDNSPMMVKRPVWDAENPPLSRRDLFRLASRRGQVVIARAMTQDSKTTARRPSRERQRVLNAMAHLLPLEGGDCELLPAGLGFAALTISDECTACGVCARACPTEALQFVQEEKAGYRLTFSPQACIGCEICAHVCAPAAVTVEPRPTFGYVFGRTEPMTLRAGDLVHCERCRAPFATRPGARLCPTCEFRRQHPFGSRPIPGLAKVRS